jgi:hypothetical protein
MISSFDIFIIDDGFHAADIIFTLSFEDGFSPDDYCSANTLFCRCRLPPPLAADADTADSFRRRMPPLIADIISPLIFR